MANPYERLVRKLGEYSWFAELGRRLVPVDRALNKLSRGRLNIAGKSADEYLLLTCVGRTSGQPRTVPLLYVHDGADVIVAASNWGQAHHPAWSSNLLADPDARVTVGSDAFDVRAHLVEGADREALWSSLVTIWPGYDSYAERAARDIRVFRLVRR